MSALNRRAKLAQKRGIGDIDEELLPNVTVKQASGIAYGDRSSDVLAVLDQQQRVKNRTQFGAFRLTGVGLEIGDAPRDSDWVELGEFLFQLEGSIQWLIGDWLAYGEDVQWGDIPTIAAKLGRDETTLHNYTSTSRRVKFWLRNQNLSYNHHRAVTHMDEAQQRASLAYAAEHKLSVADFRKWLKGDTSPALPSNTAPDTEIKALQKQAVAWLQAPKAKRLQIAQALRQMADALEQ